MNKKHISKLLVGVIVCLLGTLLPLLANSNAVYAGRKQILTDRFQIIYEPQDAWAAQRIANFSDEVYEDLTSLLEHIPKKKIPVILVNRTATANGYYSPFPPTVTLFITSPDDRFLGSRTSNWLRSLFIHELTHYIHLTAPVGPAKFLTPIFGPDVPAMNSLLMPGWWVEGITTYTESTRAEGGRGDAPLFALTYRAPLHENTMWSIAQGAYNSAYPPRGRIYSTGYLMVNHLAETYGESIFSEINRKFAAWPFFGMTSALKRSIGKSAKEVFNDALEQVAQTLPKHETLAPRYSPNAVGDYYLPYPTAQGLLGFARTLDDGGIIVNYTYQGAKTVAKIPIYAPKAITFTQDGLTAYISYYWEDPTHAASTSSVAVSYADIYRYHIMTNNYEPVTDHARLLHPSVSPDGNRLVAIEPVGDRYRLVEIDLISKEITPLYENLQGSVYEPQFSPDGTLITFIEVISGQSTLLLLSDKGEKTVLWPHSAGEIHNPRFIDNHTIWFSSDMDGTLALYSVDISSGKLSHVYNDPLGLIGAITSEEGVIYSTYTANGYALRQFPLTGLETNPVYLPKTSLPLQTIEHITQYPSSTYYDTPRFNLWLPLLLGVRNEIIPGATILMRSPLGRHTLSFSAGWSFVDALPRGDLNYQFTPGPFTISLQGIFTKSQNFLTTLTLPIWRSSTPKGFQRLSLLTALRTTIRDTVTTGGEVQLRYAYGSHSGPKDYFGTQQFSIATAVVVQQDFQPNRTSLLPLVGISGQIPLWHHHALQLEIEAATVTSPGGSIEGLFPDNLTFQNRVGEAKALLSLRYHIPLGVFDQPIPYGGLTGMGLSLHAQTAGYLISGKAAWEEDVYVGALLSADISMGSGFTLQPYVGVTLSTVTGRAYPTFGLNMATLFSNELLSSRLK